MILKIVRLYRNAKRGVADPSGFVGEEIMDAYIGAALIPGLILLAVVILLGILGFSDLIVSSSLAARILFWIFLFVELVYAFVAFVFGKMLARIISRGKQFARDTFNKINQ